MGPEATSLRTGREFQGAAPVLDQLGQTMLGQILMAPVEMARTTKRHVLIPGEPVGKMNALAVPLGGKLTRDQAIALRSASARHGLNDVSDRGVGVTMTNFSDDPPAR